MDDVNIVIPSYKRAERLRDATLAYLKSQGIPAKQITIVVATKEEEGIYKGVVPKELYGKMVVGKPGVMEVRNFITGYFPKDAKVLSMDDDISDMLVKEGKELRSVPSLKELIKMGFDLCEARDRHIWGIYPIANHFFMKEEPSFDLKFLIGHFFGMINKKVFTHIDYKEDYERSLEYALMDGGVVRFNNIAAKTVFGAAGGVGKSAKERIDVYKKEVDFLMKKYPGLVRKNPKREGEILLARSVEGFKKAD
jgi:hypothetical protein